MKALCCCLSYVTTQIRREHLADRESCAPSIDDPNARLVLQAADPCVETGVEKQMVSSSRPQSAADGIPHTTPSSPSWAPPMHKKICCLRSSPVPGRTPESWGGTRHASCALLFSSPRTNIPARHGVAETRGVCRVLLTTAHGRDGPREARIRPCRAPAVHGC